MTRPDISRAALDGIAADLRAMADAAKESATRYEIEGDADNAEHWTGRAAGLMDAHSIAMAALTAGQPPISIGDEVRFLWPSQATPALTNIDSHYDVMHVENGMVAVKRTIYRPRGEMRGAWHWAPLSAVERVDVKGHRCFGELSGPAVTEGGA